MEESSVDFYCVYLMEIIDESIFLNTVCEHMNCRIWKKIDKTTLKTLIQI